MHNLLRPQVGLVIGKREKSKTVDACILQGMRYARIRMSKASERMPARIPRNYKSYFIV